MAQSIRDLRKAVTAAKRDYLRALQVYNRAFLRYARAKRFGRI